MEKQKRKIRVTNGEVVRPSPGMYKSRPFMHYLQWNCLDYSTLKWGKLSAEHMKAAIDRKLRPVDSAASHMRIGRAIHARLLEPEDYKKRFVIADTCCAAIGSGKRIGERCGNAGVGYVCSEKDEPPSRQWYCGVHSKGVKLQQPEEFLSEQQAERIEGVWESVRSHPVVRLLRQHGGTEVSAVWECKGVTLKGRFDKYIPQGGNCPPTIIDVKKVQVGRGGDDEFSRAIQNYSYHIQAAMYTDAVVAIDGVEPAFIWVVVEDDYPFSVNVIRANPETIQIGRQAYRAMLDVYNHCMATGRWPGYATDVHLGGLPDWYVRQHSQQT